MKPPRLFVVRRLRDNQDLVAKVVEGAEEEKCILQYLREKDPIGRYIIPLESIASSNLGLVILLPVRASVRQLMKQSNGSGYGGRLVHFAEELIKGVAFIHRNGVAHLDIKPDNLVYTYSFRLQIIDFDVSVRVEDEYVMFCEEVGTSDYAAPEIGRGAFSPILADRWSCGKTIDELVEFDEGGGASRRERLSRFASRLMDVIPRQRPSLQEWSRFEETEGEDKDKVESLPASTIGFKRLYDESDDGSGKRSKLWMNEAR
ncbi:kinase-like domain-containing protein, partial [Mycena pura]